MMETTSGRPRRRDLAGRATTPVCIVNEDACTVLLLEANIMEVNCCCRYASKSGSVGGGRRGGHKRKAEWSAPAWARRSENYDDAPLSVDQVDVIPLWTPAKLVAGAKGTAKVCLRAFVYVFA